MLVLTMRVTLTVSRMHFVLEGRLRTCHVSGYFKLLLVKNITIGRVRDFCTTFEPDGCFRCKLFTLNQNDDSVAQKCLGLPVKLVPPLRLFDENSS